MKDFSQFLIEQETLLEVGVNPIPAFRTKDGRKKFIKKLDNTKKPEETSKSNASGVAGGGSTGKQSPEYEGYHRYGGVSAPHRALKHLIGKDAVVTHYETHNEMGKGKLEKVDHDSVTVNGKSFKTTDKDIHVKTTPEEHKEALDKAKKEAEDNYKSITEALLEDIKVGDFVHTLKMGQNHGVVTKIEEHPTLGTHIHFKVGKDRYGDKILKSPVSNIKKTTKDQVEKYNKEALSEGILDVFKKKEPEKTETKSETKKVYRTSEEHKAEADKIKNSSKDWGHPDSMAKYHAHMALYHDKENRHNDAQQHYDKLDSYSDNLKRYHKTPNDVLDKAKEKINEEETLEEEYGLDNLRLAHHHKNLANHHLEQSKQYTYKNGNAKDKDMYHAHMAHHHENMMKSKFHKYKGDNYDYPEDYKDSKEHFEKAKEHFSKVSDVKHMDKADHNKVWAGSDMHDEHKHLFENEVEVLDEETDNIELNEDVYEKNKDKYVHPDDVPSDKEKEHDYHVIYNHPEEKNNFKVVVGRYGSVVKANDVKRQKNKDFSVSPHSDLHTVMAIKKSDLKLDKQKQSEDKRKNRKKIDYSKPLSENEIEEICEDTKLHLAMYNGRKTTAKRVDGKWHVGGDVVDKGASVQIMAHHFGTDKPEWHKLKGNRLQFDDFASEKDQEEHNKLNEEEICEDCIFGPDLFEDENGEQYYYTFDEETLTEARIVVKVRGAKRVKKLQCGPNQIVKMVNGRRVCTNKSGKDKFRLKMAARKRKRTIRSKGAGAMRRANFRRQKSNRIRERSGLNK